MNLLVNRNNSRNLPDQKLHMKKLRPYLSLAVILLLTLGLKAQTTYQYSVNLNSVQDDKLNIELITPKITKPTAVFAFPKIIPGTYAISDYGKFVTDVKAFDKQGKVLTVTKQSENSWKIAKGTALYKITYKVEDVYDTEKKHGLYPMAATNIEEGKNFVFNNPGFFGYVDGYNKMPFEVTFQKPAELYASTALKPVSSTATKDVFKAQNLDELYDNPIMYSVPDTTSVQVGNCQVLVSVYSPNKRIESKQVAEWLSDLLFATNKYLGGKLPADKYAFIYYFKDLSFKHAFPAGLSGALEHNTSSFYYLPEVPPNNIRNSLVDMSSHEFFHIITPLTISSKQIKEFNFNEAELSKHLWLYEGVTEYTAHHVQVKGGLNTIPQFLDKLSKKITNSRTKYNDTLPFTALSKEAAGKYEKQYGNVYEKGALIGAVLDIYLLHLSGGNYGLRDLTQDLGVRYGRERYFNDEELFTEIGKLTYPQIKEFLEKYVEGSAPIPYDYYFGLAGIKFTPKTERQVFSHGGIVPTRNDKGGIAISPLSKFNDFGNKLGYKAGDELYGVNGVPVGPQNLLRVLDSIKNTMKEGSMYTVKVGRANEGGAVDTMTLGTTVFKVTEAELNKLELSPTATAKEKMIQKAWLTATRSADASEVATANPNDVSSIDAIVNALYNVISGPPGNRDWNRFNSLFLLDAKMGAASTTPTGEVKYTAMTPQDYRRNNSPFFMQSGFYEEELKRNVSQFGNIASIQSSYQFKMNPAGPVAQRGVNYITLVKHEGRWWISNLTWQGEDQQNPLPASLQK